MCPAEVGGHMHSGLVLVNPKNSAKVQKSMFSQGDRQKVIGLAPASALRRPGLLQAGVLNLVSIADISIWTAVLAGALSFLSPCVLPLVPPYLCYMAGISVDQFRGGETQVASTGTRRAVFGAAFLLHARLCHGVRGAWGRGIQHRPGAAPAYRHPVAHRRHRHHHHGPAFPRRVPDRHSRARGAVPGRAASRRRCRAPISWGSPSPLAGRPASVRCSAPSSALPRPATR